VSCCAQSTAGRWHSQDAVENAIYRQLIEHNKTHYDLWIDKDGDLVEWPISTPPYEGLAECVWDDVWAEDILGPYWYEGLEEDEEGRPVVTPEMAKAWAEVWMDSSGYDVVQDIMCMMADYNRESEFWTSLKRSW